MDNHVGDLKTTKHRIKERRKSSDQVGLLDSPPKKGRKSPPEINTQLSTEQMAPTKVTVVTTDAPVKHSKKASSKQSTESPKESLRSGEDSVDHLGTFLMDWFFNAAMFVYQWIFLSQRLIFLSSVNAVAYYVDQIPSLANLCWHRLETNADSDEKVVYVPARICAVKKASQQAMIDDLGFLKCGRFRVVPTSELIRYSGASQKKKWCSKLMKEYLDYISQHHNENDVKEEERFLKKVLSAVKEKDHGNDDVIATKEARDDDGSEKAEELVKIHSKKHGTFTNVHATNHHDVRDDAPNSRDDSAGAFPTDRNKDKISGMYYAKKLQDAKDKHTTKQETRVKFDMSDMLFASRAAASAAPDKTASTVKAVVKQFDKMQMDASPADKSGLDAETWWIVLRGTKLTRGATPLVNRCMRTYGWNEDFATRVLMGYKQFCGWKQAFEDWDDSALVPPLPIRQMWQQHLLDSRNYQADCMLLFGNVLQYNPENGADTMLERERIENTKRIAHVRFRGKDYDKEVWTWQQSAIPDFGVTDVKGLMEETKRESRPVQISLPHNLSSTSDDGVPQSMREALALVQQARRELKAPKAQRPYSLNIMPNASSSSGVSSVSSNHVIRLRIIGNGKNGLRSASIAMDYAGSFNQVFEEYANEYAHRVGQARVSLRFLTKDGRRIIDSDTPKSLRLLNNDEIMVVQPERDQSSWI